MKIIISKIVLVFLMTSCLANKGEDNYVKDFHERLKKHESELSILNNVFFDSRGKRNNRVFIPVISVALSETENINIPAIYPEMTDENVST